MSNQTKPRVSLERYLSQFPDQRKTDFNCPVCDANIGTLKPDVGENPFDSLSSCPDCMKVFFKVVESNGCVKTYLNLNR